LKKNIALSLAHIIDNEKAEIGLFISIDEATRPMTEEVAIMGFFN